MRLLFLCKRHPQQRDLLQRPYGRFFHLPSNLAGMGLEVRVILVSHDGSDSEVREFGGCRWQTLDLRRMGPLALYQQVLRESAGWKPDWVVGFSDAQFGWLAHKVARRIGARLAVDAYDNYEAYMRWNLPLHWLWRSAVSAAELVTAAGPQLADLLQTWRQGQAEVQVLPMAADPGFIPLGKQECRRALGLPTDAPLVGYSGGWGRSRGTDVLLDAFEILRQRVPEVQLVLSGRPPAKATGRPGVKPLGYLADSSLPLLANAVDVACVLAADTAFGRFSYPAKLCEAMACGTPVVASATDPIRWMLEDNQTHLAPVADAPALARQVELLLGSGRAQYAARDNWLQLSLKLRQLLSAPTPP